MIIDEVKLGPNPTKQQQMWKVLLEAQQFSSKALQRLVELEKDPARREIFKNAALKFYEAMDELEKVAE